MWQKRTNLNSIEAVILANFGVSAATDLNQWFAKSRSDSYRIDGITDAIDLLNKNKNKNIVICGDYDNDGIAAVSIMLLALRDAGFEKVNYLIPYRHTEGYGLNERMVREIADKYGPDSVIFTVDNGIATFKPIELAKSLGMTVIVTDHHIGQTDEDGNRILPKADIIINPSFMPETADFNKYCGAGIAYKFAVKLMGNRAKILMPIAAIATFADVMPLVEENYVFARDGLKAINRGFMPEGLKALIEANKLDRVTESSVGFKLAPEFNAPGRMFPDGANKAVELLSNPDADKKKLANELIEINEERKDAVEEATKTVDALTTEEKDVYVVYPPNINPGIVGIIAGRLCDTKKRPAVVFTDSYAEEGVLTGSARSVPNLNIKATLDTIANVIKNYGGHEGAAGIGIYKKCLDLFTDALVTAVENQHLDFNPPDINFYDMVINIADLRQAIDVVDKFAPYGEGNPPLVFKIEHFMPTLSQRMPDGTKALYKEVAKGGIRMSSMFGTAIGFGLTDKIKALDLTKPLTIYGKISMNYFNGTATPQIEMIDIEQ